MAVVVAGRMQLPLPEDEPEAEAEPRGSPSYEDLTVALAPGNTLTARVLVLHSLIDPVTDAGIAVSGLRFLMDVAGREALIECSLVRATYTGCRGRGQQQQEEQRARSRSRSRQDRRSKSTQQQDQRVCNDEDAESLFSSWEYDESDEVRRMHAERSP